MQEVSQMGACTSSTKVKDDVPAKKAEPVNGAKHTPAAEPKGFSDLPTAEQVAARSPNPNVKVDFGTSGTPDMQPVGEPTGSLERKWSKPPSFKSQVWHSVQARFEGSGM